MGSLLLQVAFLWHPNGKEPMLDELARWEVVMAGIGAQEELETRIRVAHELAEWDEVAALALTGYGPEILGYLVAYVRDHDLGRDAFSQFGEDMWRGIPQFAWRSSFRTWA